MEPFFAYIRQFGKVPEEDALILSKYAKCCTYRAGEFFLKPGQVSHRVGFVLEGVFRVYVMGEKDKEITRVFPIEDCFVVDLSSYNGQTPSIEYWEALSAIEMVYWERADINRMEVEVSCWHQILIPMMQHILVSAAHERNEMFSDDASTRYAKFLARYPSIVQRVPLRYIANYLGIAPQSLSRIRQQLGSR
jgi:CRP-like cAMP-binding protein